MELALLGDANQQDERQRKELMCMNFHLNIKKNLFTVVFLQYKRIGISCLSKVRRCLEL